MKSGILFDMDGVLFNSEQMVFEAFKKELTNHGFNMTIQQYRSYIGLSNRDMHVVFDEMFRLDDSHAILEGIFNNINSYTEQHAPSLCKGVRALLAAIAAREIPIAICTATEQHIAQRYIMGKNIAHYFKGVISGDQVQHSKPKPDIYNKGLEMLDKSADEVVAIEDTPYGLQAAAAAHIRVIHVPDLLPSDDYTRSLAFATYASLMEVEKNLDSILQ